MAMKLLLDDDSRAFGANRGLELEEWLVGLCPGFLSDLCGIFGDLCV
jgi:hypothetical protein